MNEEISMTFEDAVDLIWNINLVKSSIFSLNIDNFIKNNISDNINYDMILDLMLNYVNVIKDENILDSKLKDNIYYFVNYMFDKIDSMDKFQKNEKLNSLKLIFNSCGNNNIAFMRDQISIRDFGLKYNNHSLALHNLRHSPDSLIEYYKDIYYNSISNDFVLFRSMLLPDEEFYSDSKKSFWLCKDFYRSINNFLLTNNFLFYNQKYFDRLKYIIDMNINLLTSDVDEINLDEFDQEFVDIANVSMKLVKKFEKRKR